MPYRRRQAPRYTSTVPKQAEAKVRIEHIHEPFEFTDTDGDHNRLEMDADRLYWLEPDAAGGWKEWGQGPFALNMETGCLSCNVGNATMLLADVARFLCSFDSHQPIDANQSRGSATLASVGNNMHAGRQAERLQAHIKQEANTQNCIYNTTSASMEVARRRVESNELVEAVEVAGDACLISQTASFGSSVSDEGDGLSLHNVKRSSRRDGEHSVARSYATMSQRRGGHKLQSSHLAHIWKEGFELPMGVWYQDGAGDSYEVHVVRMEQTHVESGSVRKIRREKPAVWRFFKRGGNWGTYPRDVCIELDRVFLANSKRKTFWHGHEDADISQKASSTPLASTSALPLGVTPSAGDFAGKSLVSVHEMVLSAPDHSLSAQDVDAACDLLFSSAEDRPAERIIAANLLLALASHHGLTCNVTHARHAGLVIGSMCLLQAVFASTPSLCLVGEDVFNRRYPKLRMQDEGRKNSIRCLLARGMSLGSNDRPPHSKLLRKIEADAEPRWAERCLDGMMRICPQLPESIRSRVLAWLGIEEDDDENGVNDES